MTPQERQLIDDLFDRLAKLESATRDPEAMSAIMQGLRNAPNAVYALVQTVAAAGRSAEARQQPHPGTGSGGAGEQRSIRRVPRSRCATRSSGRTSTWPDQARCRTSAPPEMLAAAVRHGTRGQVLQQAPASRDNMVRRPTASRMAAPQQQPSCGRRWRLVPRNRGGSRGRRGRRIAAGSAASAR